MPLKLVPPRAGKSPNWSIRGTYLGVYVDKSCGTDRRSVAAQLLKDIREKIERRQYEKKAAPDNDGPTFLSAAVKYMDTGGNPRYVAALIKRFGETPLHEITQDAIDSAAIEMYPNVKAASRNAYVYVPMSAILRRAGSDMKIKKPIGAQGRTITDYLTPEDAAAIIRCAEAIKPEFALFLRVLLYTGCRLKEAMNLRPEDVQPAERLAWIAKSKNGKPRTILLRQDLCGDLARHVSQSDRRFFNIRAGGQIYWYLICAKLDALGISHPRRRPIRWKQPPNRLAFCNFHTFRHTWATWMRRYGGADLQGLVATGNWSDSRSAQRYAHVVSRDEWNRVDQLPSIGKAEGE